MPLRLDSLRRHPEAFGSDASEETAETIGRWFDQAGTVVLGAFVGDGPRGYGLAGSATLFVSPRVKLRHVGQIFGVYVVPDWRRTGLARALMRGLIAHAGEKGLSSLILSVTCGNGTAERFYLGLGFRSYGVQPRSLRIGGVYYDTDLMVLDLD